MWLNWLGVLLQSQKVTGSLSSQGIWLSCRFGPWLEHIWEAADWCFSPSLPPSLSLSLKINKILKTNKKIFKNGQRIWLDISQRRPTINSYMKKCSTSPVIIEIQIKTAMWYLLTPVNIAIIQTNKQTNEPTNQPTRNNKGWWGCGEMGTLLHC